MRPKDPRVEHPSLESSGRTTGEPVLLWGLAGRTACLSIGLPIGSILPGQAGTRTDAGHA